MLKSWRGHIPVHWRFPSSALFTTTSTWSSVTIWPSTISWSWPSTSLPWPWSWPSSPVSWSGPFSLSFFWLLLYLLHYHCITFSFILSLHILGILIPVLRIKEPEKTKFGHPDECLAFCVSPYFCLWVFRKKAHFFRANRRLQEKINQRLIFWAAKKKPEMSLKNEEKTFAVEIQIESRIRSRSFLPSFQEYVKNTYWQLFVLNSWIQCYVLIQIQIPQNGVWKTSIITSSSCKLEFHANNPPFRWETRKQMWIDFVFLWKYLKMTRMEALEC